MGTKKRKENIPDFLKNNSNEEIRGAQQIAEGFNSFFAGIGPELANNIAPSNIDFLEDNKEMDAEPRRNKPTPGNTTSAKGGSC